MITLAVNHQAAVDYWFMGWHPIPLCWPVDGGCICESMNRRHPARDIGKNPLLPAGWGGIRNITLADIDQWWGEWPNANIGILLHPSNLFVVDCDTTDAIAEAEALGLPPAPQCETGQGAHFYYRRPFWAKRRVIWRGDSRKIDILCDGYTIVPPSLHQSGREYTWIEPPNSAQHLSLPPEWCIKEME